MNRSSRFAAIVALIMPIVGACGSTRASGPAVEAALACRPEALIQLRSDGCDTGRCPVYGVSIFVDGSVVYGGGANVAVGGPRQSKVASANLAALVSAFEKIDFIDVPEHCCDCPDDPDDAKASKLVVDYRPGGVQKEIVIDERCSNLPEALRGLTGQIATLAGIGSWITPAGPRATARLASDAPPKAH